MNGKGSKAKGSNFERSTCKELSLWLTRGMQDDLFWRSAMSGGRATLKRKLGKGGRNLNQGGDICAIHTHGDRLTGLFLIECKCYKDLRILSMLECDATGQTLASFWYRCCADAKTARKMPLLIAKQNQRQTWLLLDEAGMDKLMPTQAMHGNPERDYRPSHNITYFGGPRAYLMDFSVFLAHARRP